MENLPGPSIKKALCFCSYQLVQKITKIEILTLPYIFSVLNLLSISQVAEEGYNTLQNVADNIQIKIRLPSTTNSEREILKSHYFEMKSVPMLSANGYFDIGNQTLVSMLSVRKAIIFRLKQFTTSFKFHLTKCPIMTPVISRMPLNIMQARKIGS